ncbi:MAG: phospholipase, partial [Epsilonproteobacteria bacterium]|nr:phospholipase [Campylobacterota bacterium]
MDVELLAYFLSVIVSFHILTQRRSAPSIIAWLLGLIVAPLATSIIYMLVGRRKFNFNTLKSMPKMERTPNDLKALNHIDQLLQNIGIAPASGDNEIELITSSTKAHKELINSIKEAKYSIDIETYILKPDKIGKEIIGELEKKAKEGVRVRVLLDAIGSLYLYFYRKPLKRLIDSGGEVIFFMPPNFLLFRWLINLRDHRKIYLFDREILYSGGMNLAYEYLGEDNHPKVWKDLLFKAKGTIVYRYLSVFEADFSFAKNIEYIAPEIPLKREIFKGAILQPVPSGPDMEKDTLLESILEAISKAKERVWIVTPYLIIDEPLFEAFKIASHRGVDIKIITPLK